MTKPLLPTGETYEDHARLQNLIETCELIDELVDQVIEVTSLKDVTQFSMRRAGERADEFLKQLKTKI